MKKPNNMTIANALAAKQEMLDSIRTAAKKFIDATEFNIEEIKITTVIKKNSDGAIVSTGIEIDSKITL